MGIDNTRIINGFKLKYEVHPTGEISLCVSHRRPDYMEALRSKTIEWLSTK